MVFIQTERWGKWGLSNLVNYAECYIEQMDSSEKLRLARWNTAALMFFLYIQEIFWWVASRFQIYFFEEFYAVSPLDGFSFLWFCSIALSFSVIAVLATKISFPVPRVIVPRCFVNFSVWGAILCNIAIFVFLDEKSRYTSGALTGISGVVYFLGRAINLAAMLLMIKSLNVSGLAVSRVMFILFLTSFALTIDGLASALLLVAFLVLMMKGFGIYEVVLMFFSPRSGLPKVFFVSAIGALVFYVGFSAKFSQVPDYLSVEFLVRWAVSRFSIQAEQAYSYLSGFSSIGSEYGYLELIGRAISDRADVILGINPDVQYPRNISEAIHYDMKGLYGSGSSPGLLMNTAMQKVFFFLPILFYSFIFLQFFYNFTEKVTLLHLFSYAFLFKALHTNFSEFFVIISPNLLYLVVFVVVAVIEPRKKSYNL